MSDRPRHARLSRLDPIHWPPGTGIALFAGWVIYVAVSAAWLHPLLWTVLPIGLTLYLFAERYPWRIILAFVAPLALLTASAQVLASSSDAPVEVAFGVYVLACTCFSFVLFVPDRDGWVGRLPGWFLGERFEARLTWSRFEDSLVAANAVVREIDADDDPAARRAAMDRIAKEARRESRRGMTWREAWTALAAWLETLIDLVGTEHTPDQVRHVHQLLVELDAAHMKAIEKTGTLDPT